MSDVVQSRLPRRMLERPCYGSDRCTAGAGELCVDHHGVPMLDITHVWRSWDPQTGNLPVLEPAAAPAQGRHRMSEAEIRADERAQISLALTGWLSGLAETDPRRTGVLAVLDRLGGER